MSEERLMYIQRCERAALLADRVAIVEVVAALREYRAAVLAALADINTDGTADADVMATLRARRNAIEMEIGG